MAQGYTVGALHLLHELWRAVALQASLMILHECCVLGDKPIPNRERN